MTTRLSSDSTDHLGGLQGPTAKPLNTWGFIALVILFLRNLAGPLVDLVHPDDLGAAILAGYAGIFLTLIALGCGIAGLMRRETRAYWTAIAATAIATWRPLSHTYLYLINRMALAAI